MPSRLPVVVAVLAFALAPLARAQDPTPPKPAEPPKAEKPSPKPGDESADKALAEIRKFIATQKIDKTASDWKSKVSKPPQLTFDPAKKYYWNLKTNKGDIKILFAPDVAPMHVSSFIYLSEIGFFDGVNFHRVIPGFMAQGGDPTGTGSGGPGYKLTIEVKPDVKHDKIGVVSTANTGQPGSDGSQFFIMFRDYSSLDGKYTIFGRVADGLDTVKKLEAAGNPDRASNGVPPKEKLTIEKATITVE